MNTKWVIATALLFTVSWAIDASAHSRGRGGNRHSNSTSLAERLALNEEQQVDLQALKAGIMEQKMALYEEHQARFAAVLTTGQLAAYDALKDVHRKHSRVSLSETLGLTDDQVAELQALGEEKRLQHQALHEAYQADFTAILSAEQLAAYEELKANRMGRRLGKGKTEVVEAAEKGVTSKTSPHAIPTAVDLTSAYDRSVDL